MAEIDHGYYSVMIDGYLFVETLGIPRDRFLWGVAHGVYRAQRDGLEDDCDFLATHILRVMFDIANCDNVEDHCNISTRKRCSQDIVHLITDDEAVYVFDIQESTIEYPKQSYQQYDSIGNVKTRVCVDSCSFETFINQYYYDFSKVD